MNEIVVSISCLVYNHEKYLRRCLDGFVTQKTTFAYEILIHDDCSTDNSRQIIEEYCTKYPDLFVPIFQKENQFSKGIKISFDIQYPRARGKYIALCEGDDFWDDPFKLQKQFDVLEKNQDCLFCCHSVKKINEEGNPLNSVIKPKTFLNGKIDGKTFLKNYFSGKEGYPFQTSSYFFKKDLALSMPDFKYDFRVGDIPMFLWAAHCGNLFFLDEPLSCYRVNVPGSTNANSKKLSYYLKNNICGIIKGFSSFNTYTGGCYYSYMYHLLCYYCYQMILADKFFVPPINQREILKELTFKEKMKCKLKLSPIGNWLRFFIHKIRGSQE